MNNPKIRVIYLFAITFTILFVVLSSSCSKQDQSSGGKKGKGLEFPVEVATVASRTGSLVINAIGSIEAFEIIQVTSRVSGSVQKVRFKEGEVVKAGDPLVEIEPERFELSVRSAEAAYERAKASRHEAQAGLTRRMDIQEKNPGFVSLEDLDSWQTKALASQADSAQAAANLELARLNLRDSYVPAPASGVVQSRAVRTGQFVNAGTPIATMVRRDPLLLRFAVSDQDAQRLEKGQDVVFTVRNEGNEHKAKITAVTDFADPVTRMVNVTSEVTDPERESLRPGSFAEVTVLLGEADNMPVIPQLSIRPSEKGFLVYVVSDKVAHERVLTLGLQSPDGNVEVRGGLQVGETIVIRGAEALSNGVTVRVVTSGSTDSTAASAKRGKQS